MEKNYQTYKYQNRPFSNITCFSFWSNYKILKKLMKTTNVKKQLESFEKCQTLAKTIIRNGLVDKKSKYYYLFQSFADGFTTGSFLVKNESLFYPLYFYIKTGKTETNLDCIVDERTKKEQELGSDVEQ